MYYISVLDNMYTLIHHYNYYEVQSSREYNFMSINVMTKILSNIEYIYEYITNKERLIIYNNNSSI